VRENKERRTRRRIRHEGWASAVGGASTLVEGDKKQRRVSAKTHLTKKKNPVSSVDHNDGGGPRGPEERRGRLTTPGEWGP